MDLNVGFQPIVMEKLRSIDRIKNSHSFQSDLKTIPAVDWMEEGSLDNYEAALYETLEKLETIDTMLEILLKGPEDKRLKTAVAEIFGKDTYTSIKEVIIFQKYFPLQYHVQKEKDLLDTLIAIGRRDEYEGEFEDVNEDVKILLQSEWEVNPKISNITIDESDMELNLQDTFTLLRSYLEASEHEFYKQATLARLDEILDQYLRLVKASQPLFRRPKKGPKGYIELKFTDYKNQYTKFEHILDGIYYSRGRDYLIECVKLKKTMNENEFTKKYGLLLVDLKEFIQHHSP